MFHFLISKFVINVAPDSRYHHVQQQSWKAYYFFVYKCLKLHGERNRSSKSPVPLFASANTVGKVFIVKFHSKRTPGLVTGTFQQIFCSHRPENLTTLSVFILGLTLKSLGYGDLNVPRVLFKSITLECLQIFTKYCYSINFTKFMLCIEKQHIHQI